MLTFFDGLISPSNEKDVPCVYLTMNTLSILGESRGVTREWHAEGDARARGGIAARSRALSRLASLARNGELLADYVHTSLHDPGWVVRIVSILRGIPVNRPLPHQDPPEVGTVKTT